MLETVFEEGAGAAFTTTGAILGILTALLLGLAVSLTYLKCARPDKGVQNFLLTLIILPGVISVIIVLVGSNVARAFSLAGAFSLVRFRSEPGDPKDIAYICIVMAVGLACGMGYFLYAAAFTAILCAVLFLFTAIASKRDTPTQVVKITVPENLNYDQVFDSVLQKYTKSYRMLRVRTVDLGSMYRLDYEVVLKEGIRQKDFIEELRIRNGNMDISLLLVAS